MSGLSHLIFTHPQIDELFSADAQVRGMLTFESTLAKTQAGLGIIPVAAATVIAAVCSELNWNLEELAQQTLLAGNPAIPLVKALTRRVNQQDAEAAKYVHLGATSQDVLDTTLMLQLQAALSFINNQLLDLQNTLAELTAKHRDTVMIGRTLLQQARPITFGYKVAAWLDTLLRAEQRLLQVQREALALQFGGAVGTLATLGAQGPAVARQLAAALQLAAPVLPWHSQRDRLVDVAAALGILSGSLGKLGHDLISLMQTEVGEVAEGAAAGKGGSSAMPHKRNPVSATFLVAVAGRTPGLVSTLLSGLSQHEHERAAGAWHAEWEVLPELLRLTAAALAHAHDLLSTLEVDTARMRRNLDLTQGLIYAEDVTAALTPHLGKAEAQQLVEQACQQALHDRMPLRDLLHQHPEASRFLSDESLRELFDPRRATGLSQHFTDEVLARFHAPVPTT
ncbi:3-carboxy-cis,cis-muconate cycloisomerase [Hymenobacter sp.]|jgi:3-carboxy-cis,cis-muconate cycloisomerase|uniref:3-carboxy-cis,cis-muconate cycloisomerase n=1 Tax=Hymenobacter sp. TaxID=1898978 RepID=UPI002EDAB4D4